MFALAAFVFVILPHWFGLFFIMALLVAYSRVYCGVHFPGDVLIGACYGSLGGWSAARLTQFILFKFTGPAKSQNRSAGALK